jgi:hypothetical protein
MPLLPRSSEEPESMQACRTYRRQAANCPTLCMTAAGTAGASASHQHPGQPWCSQRTPRPSAWWLQVSTLAHTTSNPLSRLQVGQSKVCIRKSLQRSPQRHVGKGSLYRDKSVTTASLRSHKSKLKEKYEQWKQQTRPDSGTWEFISQEGGIQDGD